MTLGCIVAIFEWKSEYDTGIAEIDNQHMVLVSLINELHILVNEKFDRALAEEIFEKLKKYAFFHFATEENLMAQYHYDAHDNEAHLAQHRQFESEFKSVQADFENITLEECNVVLSYLTNWLTNHICKVDKRLADHIHQQRQAESEGSTHYSSAELVAQSVTEEEAISVIGSLHITQKHIGNTGEMLEQLEACIDELQYHCDVMVQSASDSVFSNMSATAHYKCTHGLKLVKLIRSNHEYLKDALNKLE